MNMKDNLIEALTSSRIYQDYERVQQRPASGMLRPVECGNCPTTNGRKTTLRPRGRKKPRLPPASGPAKAIRDRCSERRPWPADSTVRHEMPVRLDRWSVICKPRVSQETDHALSAPPSDPGGGAVDADELKKAYFGTRVLSTRI